MISISTIPTVYVVHYRFLQGIRYNYNTRCRIQMLVVVLAKHIPTLNSWSAAISYLTPLTPFETQFGWPPYCIASVRVAQENISRARQIATNWPNRLKVGNLPYPLANEGHVTAASSFPSRVPAEPERPVPSTNPHLTCTKYFIRINTKALASQRSHARLNVAIGEQ